MAGLRFRTIAGVRQLAAATVRPCRRTSLGHLLLPSSSPVDDGDHWTAWRRGHTGHSHPRDGKEAEKVFRLSLAADAGLAAGKAVAGYLSGSTAIIADAAHSVSDVVLSGVALWSFRVARTPKDNEHPYGHGKFETLGALGISCMLLGTAGGIAWHAIDVLQVILTATPDMISWTSDHAHNHSHDGHHHGIDMEHPLLALSMTIVAISVKEGLYWITKRAGEREGSTLMKANAWHHRADAISSVVALIGVGGAILGVKFLDPLAGIVVSGMILKAGIETGFQSVMELVDAAVPSCVIDPIKKTILQVEGVKDCHRMRGRRAGSSLYLDVHIERSIMAALIYKLELVEIVAKTSKVDPFLSVSAAHDIGENVRHEIQRSHPDVVEMFIHIDPKVSDSAIISNRQKVMNELSDDATSMGTDKQDIAAAVANVFSSKFAKVMELEHITHHSLEGEFLLQVQVTMSSDMSISDAKDLAKEAQKEILAAAPCVSQACILLRLGPKIVQMFDRNQNGKGYISELASD